MLQKHYGLDMLIVKRLCGFSGCCLPWSPSLFLASVAGGWVCTTYPYVISSFPLAVRLRASVATGACFSWQCRHRFLYIFHLNYLQIVSNSCYLASAGVLLQPGFGWTCLMQSCPSYYANLILFPCLQWDYSHWNPFCLLPLSGSSGECSTKFIFILLPFQCPFFSCQTLPVLLTSL